MLSNAVIEPREIRREVRSEGFFPPKWDKKTTRWKQNADDYLLVCEDVSSNLMCRCQEVCVCVCACL